MDRRRLTLSPFEHDKIAGLQFRLELFRNRDGDLSHDWSGGVLVTGSLRIELSAEHASNLARRMRAAVDATVCQSFSRPSASGDLPC